MAFRTESWDQEIAHQLQHDKAYARHLVAKLIRDGQDPEEVLKHIIRAYGLKELSERTTLRPQSIARVLRAPERAKETTLNRLLKPMGVKVRRRLAFL